MYSGEVWNLAVMNADGSGQRILGASVVQRMLGIRGAEEPAWSPEGEKIAFASYAGRNNSEIYVMNADGSAQTRLTHSPASDLAAAPSPTARRSRSRARATATARST